MTSGERQVVLVWAQDRKGAIGRDNAIPWRVPEDMRHFREVTGSDPVVMGRLTWESLPDRFRPLPGRRNIVVSRTAGFEAEGADLAEGLPQALSAAGARIVVIGGGQIYSAAMEYATDLAVTEIDLIVDGADAFAPSIGEQDWQQSACGEWHESTTGVRYRFVDYRRRAQSE